MPGTYTITETISTSPKYAVMVEFNGRTPQYYEVELKGPIPSLTLEDDAIDLKRVKAILQIAADQDLINNPV